VRDRLARLIYIVAAVLLICAVIMMTVQIVLRVAFAAPLSWVEEVVRYAFVWAVYLGSVVALTRDTHIRVMVMVEPFGKAGRRVSDALSWIVNVLCFAFVLYWGADLALKYRLAEFYTLPGVPQLIFYLSVPISMALMLLFLLIPGRRPPGSPADTVPPEI
jgi:TRAP-type C4-dicarboxylate transport system permease small subunit